ncbi:hypothetical protein QOZ80_1AG0018950 [Eleusine coracana subsp. coracana]|nr:hypothetical protein QOZ80_1AG0018950 [Eleusine coracana subsp. coracana]
MADCSMEPAALRMPCDLQLANWIMEPAVCAPGLPVEYGSTEVFGSCYQTSVPICEGGQQCEYEVDKQCNPIETENQEFVVDIHNMEMITPSIKIIPQNPIHVFRGVADDCERDLDITGNKMHRYPASIRALRLDERYTTPTVVAIGPYYHGRNRHLEKAEKMKHLAAYQCLTDSGYSVQQMYDALVPVARGVRHLYDKDVMEGIDDDDFLPMMFFDACFLVQYMLIMSHYSGSLDMEESLSTFFDSNQNEIFHDIMLLENQIPWPVVQTVMMFRPVLMEKFIYSVKDCLQDLKRREDESLLKEDIYEHPPHLLGLLRFYIVGESKTKSKIQFDSENQISLSASANELAEIGIKLKAKENAKLVHMGVETNGSIFGKLFLAPLSLDDARASCLVSMAAHELCTTSNFQDEDVKDEASAVCSYLLLLAMLVAREEDVQKLRTNHILLGAGLADSEVLDFFTKLHGLRLGSSYVRTMIEIQRYTMKRPRWIKWYAFYYRNKTTFAQIGSFTVGIATIIATILAGIKP